MTRTVDGAFPLRRILRRRARLADGAVTDAQRRAFSQRRPSHAREQVGRGAAQRERRIDAAAHREISARACLRAAASAGRSPAFTSYRSPQRQTRAEIGPGQRDHRVFLKFKLAARQRHFERGRIFRVAHQQVSGAKGQRVGRARSRNPAVGMAVAAKVLHGGQEAGRQHVNGRSRRTPGTKRSRSPMRSRTGSAALGSKSFASVWPMMRQPPGDTMGYTPV